MIPPGWSVGSRFVPDARSAEIGSPWSENELPQSKWPFYFLICILFAAGWFLPYRLDEPAWEMNHQGYIMAEWPHNAANYLRFGYLDTRFGLVMNYGWSYPAEGFDYRIDHPPLTSILISLSYLVLGVDEWSARLVPLVLSMGIIVLVYVLACGIMGRWWALLAAVLSAATPALLYFARLPVPHVPAVFFALATFVVYRQWLMTGKRLHFILLWLTFFVGAWTDWIVYFVMPWLVGHYVLFHYRRRPDRGFVLVGILLPFLTFAVYIVWVLSFAGSGPLLDLFDIFRFRTLSASLEHQQKYFFTPSEFYRLAYRWTLLYFTPVLSVLSLLWSASVLVRILRRRVSAGDFLVLCLFLYGLTHHLVFSNRAYIHDFVMVFQWIPFIALAATLGVRLIANSLPSRWRVVGGIVLTALVLVGVCAESRAHIQSLHVERIEADYFRVGREIDRSAPREARVMASFSPDIRMRFYMDRPVDLVADQETFDARVREKGVYSHYVFWSNSSAISESLRRYLMEHYPVRSYGDYTLFDLRKVGDRLVSLGVE